MTDTVEIEGPISVVVVDEDTPVVIEVGVLGPQGPNGSQQALDELHAHMEDLVDAHDASATSFDPTGTGLSSADVQSAIVESLTVTSIDGTPSDAAHTTNTSRWNAVAGTARMVVVWDSDAQRPTWARLNAVDVFEPASILTFTVTPIGSYPNGVAGSAMVASSLTDSPRFAATYQGSATVIGIDIVSHTYGGGRNPEVSASDYTQTALDGPAINRGREVGESVTFRLSATISGGTHTKDATLTYVNERIWGVSAVDIDDGTKIDTFRAAQSKELSNALAKTFAVTAGSGEYIYYLIRSALGTPTFTVGGFEGGFALNATVSWPNARGFTEDFDVWRSDNPSLGATTVVVT